MPSEAQVARTENGGVRGPASTVRHAQLYTSPVCRAFAFAVVQVTTLYRMPRGTSRRRIGALDLGASLPVLRLCWEHAAHFDPDRLVLFRHVSFDEHSATFELTIPEFEVADTFSSSPLLRLTISTIVRQPDARSLFCLMLSPTSYPSPLIWFHANVRLVAYEPEPKPRRHCEALNMM